MIKAKVKGQQVDLELNGQTDEVLIEMAMLVDDLFDGKQSDSILRVVLKITG